jgi:site-specific recombinase XerD
MGNGVAQTALKPSVLDYVDERRRRREIAPGTVGTFRECLLVFAHDIGPKREVRSIRPAQIERWVGLQLERGLAPATVRLRLSTVRGFCRWAVRNGLITRDPTLLLSAPKVAHYLPRALRPDQVGATLEQARDARERLCILLMAQEGLRGIEVERLQLGDIDMTGQSMLVKGKGGYERVLPITDETWFALEEYLNEFPARNGPLVRSYTEPTKVLGCPTIRKQVSEAMTRAGVNESGHALRHTAATQMLKNGANIRDVQTMLGHQSLQNTQRYIAFSAVGELRGLMGRTNYRGAQRAK